MRLLGKTQICASDLPASTSARYRPINQRSASRGWGIGQSDDRFPALRKTESGDPIWQTFCLILGKNSHRSARSRSRGGQELYSRASRHLPRTGGSADFAGTSLRRKSNSRSSERTRIYAVHSAWRNGTGTTRSSRSDLGGIRLGVSLSGGC